jgi:hypothetical protein
MSPYLAAKLKNVRGIIGYGCSYSQEAYSQLPPTAVHAIHGDADERVPISKSKADFQKIFQFGHKGTFHEVPGLTHRVEQSVEPLVRQIAEKLLVP